MDSRPSDPLEERIVSVDTITQRFAELLDLFCDKSEAEAFRRTSPHTENAATAMPCARPGDMHVESEHGWIAPAEAGALCHCQQFCLGMKFHITGAPSLPGTHTHHPYGGGTCTCESCTGTKTADPESLAAVKYLRSHGILPPRKKG